MQVAPLPHDELERLESLRALEMLDSEAEAVFDNLVRIASSVCGVPISLISLIESERQWFKANIGLPGVTQTSRDVAFCGHAILGHDLMEVCDAALDPRFLDNPLVIGGPEIRFYAGVPLRLGNGQPVGTLCIIDREPGQLSNMQRRLLNDLAEIAVQLIEGRRAIIAEKRNQTTYNGKFSFLESLIQQSPAGIYYSDDAGNRTYTNERLQKIWGLSAEESLGGDWKRIVHPADVAGLDLAWKIAREQGHDFVHEYRIVTAGGDVRYLDSRAQRLTDSNSTVVGYAGSIVDVTDQHMMRSQLIVNEERHHRLYEATPVMMHSTDLDGRIFAVSNKWLEKLGYRRDEVIGRSSMDFMTPASRVYAENSVIPFLFETGHFENIEHQMVRKDGALLDVLLSALLDTDEAGKPTRRLVVIEDITDRRQTERELAEANERVTMAASTGGFGIWEADPVAGTAIWDAATCQIFGLTPEASSTPHQRFWSLLHPDDTPTIRERYVAAISDWRVETLSQEFRVVWPDGSLRFVQSVARINRDANGRAVRVVGMNWDMTEQKRLAADVATQHELLRVTLQSIADAVITTDANGNIVWLNPVAEAMTGWSMADAVHHPLSDIFRIIDEVSRERCQDPVATCLAEGVIVGMDNPTVLVSRHGAEFGIEDSAAPIRGDDGKIHGVVLVFRDVTEKRRRASEMTYRASHDALTGLINRTEFESRLRKIMRRSQLEGSRHSLLSIDLDQFKIVNDTCGHAAGDLLLQQVARMFRETVRETDAVARLGGDEFGVILEYCGVEQANRAAQALCDRMDDYRFAHEGHQFRIGTSIGLVPIDARWTTLTAVLQAADAACYAAKDGGRNRVHVWDEADSARRQGHDEMHWSSRIEQALADGRFELHAQPVKSLGRSEPTRRAEILIRLTELDGNVVMPGAFLPAAERFHLLGPVDRWVISRVIRYLAMLPDLSAVACLNINVSGQSIADSTFEGWLMAELTAAGPQISQKLCFEVDETVARAQSLPAAGLFAAIRQFGARIALDNFGSGPASFSYLNEMEVDEIKIDPTFVRDLATNQVNAATLRCFAEIARVKGITTVAKGVERESTSEVLTLLGVDFQQGFAVARPIPLAAITNDAVAA